MPHTLDPTGDNTHLYGPAIFSMSHPEEDLRSAQRLTPATLSKPMAAYSQVVRKGSIVTTAGMIASGADGNVVGEGDIEAQARQTLENLKMADGKFRRFHRAS